MGHLTKIYDRRILNLASEIEENDDSTILKSDLRLAWTSLFDEPLYNDQIDIVAEDLRAHGIEVKQ